MKLKKLLLSASDLLSPAIKALISLEGSESDKHLIVNFLNHQGILYMLKFFTSNSGLRNKFRKKNFFFHFSCKSMRRNKGINGRNFIIFPLVRFIDVIEQNEKCKMQDLARSNLLNGNLTFLFTHPYAFFISISIA